MWVEPGAENARRVYAALEDFGAPLHDLALADLERTGLIFQIGVAPNRIDLLTAIDGVGFSEAWLSKSETTYGNQAVFVLGRSELLRNKRAVGRPQDLIDAEALEKLP